MLMEDVPKEMYVEFLHDINSEVDRMTAIINDLLTWMTAETEEMTKPGSGVLDLNFVHKLTKVTVTVSFNSQYPAGDNYVSMFRFFTNEESPV